MSDEKKQNSSSSNQEQKGNTNEGKRGYVIKGQIPDFKYSAPVPEKPNTTTTDKVE